MKRQAFSLVSLLSLLLVAGSAIAQTVHVRGNIPFNFAVGNKTFPAGTYDIRTISSGDSKTLRLRSEDNNASVMVNSNAAETLEPPNHTKLVFNHYGKRYFLSQIWVKGETQGRQLPKSSREKEMARDVAQNLEREQVEIMASLQ
jgi:hypothetical protein